jgi:hypothetical protein
MYVGIPRCHHEDDKCRDEPYNVHIEHESARDDQEDAWQVSKVLSESKAC